MNGYHKKLIVLCFGSLGSIKKDVWSGLRYCKLAKDELKMKMVFNFMYYWFKLHMKTQSEKTVSDS